MKNKLRAVFIAAICCLLLCSCTQEADRIYTVCRITESDTYVYNMSGNFYLWRNGNLVKCPAADLQMKPCLTLLFDDITTYTIEYEMPSCYLGTKTDALHYVTKLLQDDGAMYSLLNVDWRSFEMLVTTNLYDVRVLYSTDDKIRVYAQNKSGEAIVPPYLEDIK